MKAMKAEKYIGIGLMVAGGVALVVAVPYAVKKYKASKAVIASMDPGKTESTPTGTPPPMVKPVSNFVGNPTLNDYYKKLERKCTESGGTWGGASVGCQKSTTGSRFI